MDTLTQIRFVWKPLVFVLCLVPGLLLVGDTFEVTGSLGANPVEEIQDRLGNWGLRFIMIALAVTPLRRITGRPELIRLRRMLGLFAFFYTLLHFLAWLILDQGVYWPAIVEDITERREADLALRRSEAAFRTLIEAAPDAIAVSELETGRRSAGGVEAILAPEGRRSRVGRVMLFDRRSARRLSHRA